MAQQESSPEETTSSVPDVHRPQRRRHHEAAQLEEGYSAWSTEEIPLLIDKVRDDAIYIEKFAMEMSRQRKRPVLILCNARSGSHFHPAIINGLERILCQEERDAFASEVAQNPFWKKKGGKPRAVFETAQKWLEEGRLGSFVYPMKKIKVSSCAFGNPVMATPHGLEALITSGSDILFADYSSREFPGSFAKHDASPWGGDPGFKEYLRKKSRRYEVFLASRLSTRREHAPEECLGKAIKSRGPVAVCLNPLQKRNEDVYTFINDNHTLLGEFGCTREFSGYEERFIPTYIQTSQGRMELGDYIRRYLGERP